MLVTTLVNPHIWSFVYFHGEAERMNNKAFAEGGDAPDISIANEPIENYLPRIAITRPPARLTLSSL